MHIIRILNHVLLWSKNGYPQLHPWGVWWPGWVVRPSCLKPSSVGFNSLNGLGEPLAYLNIYLYSYLEGLVTVLDYNSDFNATNFLKLLTYLQITLKPISFPWFSSYSEIILKLNTLFVWKVINLVSLLRPLSSGTHLTNEKFLSLSCLCTMLILKDMGVKCKS